MKAKKWKKKSMIFLSVIIFLSVSIPVTIYILGENNRHVKYWLELPSETRNLSIKLEVERLFYKVFPPSPNPEVYAYINADVLLESVCLGADWIVSMQEKNGRFNYWFNPENNEYSSQSDDNFLRQAGTAYSLVISYEVSGDTNYLNAARHNLNYLFNFRKFLDDDKEYFLFWDRAKLGGIALPMLCMLKIKQLQTDTTYDEDLIKLANMLIFLQDEYNSGQYKSTYVYENDFDYELNTGWESNIYPGEAMLALAFMNESFDDAKYKKSIDWAYEYYSIKGRWRKSSFMPWTISAFVSMYLQTGDEKYAEFVFKMTRKMLRRQNMNSSREVYGSFNGLPTVFTATAIEALGDVLLMLKTYENEDKRIEYTERAKMAFSWLLKMQYTEDEIAKKNLPVQSLGGFRRSLIESEIRIDNTQHAISALCRGIKYVYNDDKETGNSKE